MVGWSGWQDVMLFLTRWLLVAVDCAAVTRAALIVSSLAKPCSVLYFRGHISQAHKDLWVVVSGFLQPWEYGRPEAFFSLLLYDILYFVCYKTHQLSAGQSSWVCCHKPHAEHFRTGPSAPSVSACPHVHLILTLPSGELTEIPLMLSVHERENATN